MCVAEASFAFSRAALSRRQACMSTCACIHSSISHFIFASLLFFTGQLASQKAHYQTHVHHMPSHDRAYPYGHQNIVASLHLIVKEQVSA